ncbi:MAG: WbqC family protein [Deltaproteobacteria bacterium]|nr:WbqC family protein [Deltaproteobacteria bacterium]
MKKIAILQSNYIPWKGYFDLIAAVDEFILYDDVQFTKNDWRNRNKIKTPKGVEWLSVPVGKNINRKIKEVELNNSQWQQNHWKTITSNYKRAPYFEEISTLFKPLYLEKSFVNLSELNRKLIEEICAFLGIKTKISDSSSYQLEGDKTERLVNLCTQTEATEYISGPAAQSYLEVEKFNQHNIKVSWFEYGGYPEYPQLWGPFEHGVSILDLLFNCGPESNRFMKYVSNE